MLITEIHEAVKTALIMNINCDLKLNPSFAHWLTAPVKQGDPSVGFFVYRLRNPQDKTGPKFWIHIRDNKVYFCQATSSFPLIYLLDFKGNLLEIPHKAKNPPNKKIAEILCKAVQDILKPMSVRYILEMSKYDRATAGTVPYPA